MQAHAQQAKGIVSPDSLLKLFRSKSPFEVLLDSKMYYPIDVKAAYFNPELKAYLLLWLSKKEYLEYTIEKDIKKFSADPNSIKNAIEYKLAKKGHSAWLDSIVKNPDLYSKYRDSVITDELAIYRAVRKVDSYYPPSQAIGWHTRIPYPESYTIIRQWWEESGRVTFDGNQNFNPYFLALVKMGDPQARGLFDAQIDTFIKTNGKSLSNEYLNSILKDMRNSYATAKMLALLKVTNKVQWIADGNDAPTPFNCEIQMNLMQEFAANSIAIDSHLKASAPCESQLKFTRQLKEAGQRLMAKYQEEEKYWMQNIPFATK